MRKTTFVRWNARNFFEFKRLNWFDVLSLLILVAVTIVIFWLDKANANLASAVLITGIGCPLFLYLLCYQSLRKFNVWLIWFLISIFHLVYSAMYGDLEVFQLPNGNSATIFGRTWFFLMLFQCFRLLSLNYEKVELVAPARGSATDIWDGRKIRRTDYIFFLIYAFIFLLSHLVFN